MNELWKQVLDELQIEMSQPRFIAFFKSTHLVSLENDVATIGTINSMAADLLEKNYYALIKSILEKKTGKKISLIFTVKKPIVEERKDAGPLFSERPTVAVRQRPNRIREDFTFDTLAVSDTNQLAYTASFAVATEPGGKYNPLFLYGSVGVGKTHLMHSIANTVFDNDNSSNIVYLSTEEFTNEMVEAIQTKSTSKLRKKFRSIDLLLLDDIQFLSGKEKVQEELFHTFNTLVDNKSQVIFASDRPPSAIKRIDARLASRLESGLTIDIESPDFELRTAILLIKSKKHGLPLTTVLAQRVAEKIIEPRALEGFLLKLSTMLTMSGATDITIGIVDKCLGNIREARPTIHPDDVVRVVCNYFEIKSTQLKGARRDASLVRARHLCMYILKEVLGTTLVDIGNLLGGRDHTTIMHGVGKIRILNETDPVTQEVLTIIKDKLEAGE